MPEFQIKKGKIIFEAGSMVSSLAYIEQGKVRMALPGCEVILTDGDVIGISDITHQVHSCSYFTLEDTVVETFACKNTAEFGKLLADSDIAQMMLSGFSKQLLALMNTYVLRCYNAQTLYTSIFKLYEDYTLLCKENGTLPKELAGISSLEKLLLDHMISSWKHQYYKDLCQKMEAGFGADFEKYSSFYMGLIYNGCDDFEALLTNCSDIDDYMQETANVLMNDAGNDLFGLYCSLLPIIAKNKKDNTSALSALDTIHNQVKKIGNLEKDVITKRISDLNEELAHLKTLASQIEESSELIAANEDIQDSLSKLLDYAEYEDNERLPIQRLFSTYASLTDRGGTDDATSKIRKAITDVFYKLYSAVFFKAVADMNVPTIVKMFLNFGYMDETIAGAENALYLYSLAENLGGDHINKVYTAADWLTLIYQGDKNPRRNEFDLDYPAYITDQARSGLISREEAERLQGSRRDMVLFEINNLFRLGNRVTYGRVTTFCPVFSDHNISKPLPDCLCTPKRLTEELNKIIDVDFGAFCRPVIYSNTELGIHREYLQIEIRPDFILMPNVGIRGSMWQEIEGRDKQTPSTFLLPVFLQENFETVLTRLVGEFRWEMCKRIQGSTWNDVTDHSLTSDYFDYCQFYKKNNELTPEAKEKLATQLRKYKSNYKECFLMDYAAWVLFEAKGSPRLNKFARSIMFQYCTFSKPIRDKLLQNPMYEPIVIKRNMRHAKEVKRLDQLIFKLQRDGEVPEEITALREFMER